MQSLLEYSVEPFNRNVFCQQIDQTNSDFICASICNKTFSIDELCDYKKKTGSNRQTRLNQPMLNNFSMYPYQNVDANGTYNFQYVKHTTKSLISEENSGVDSGSSSSSTPPYDVDCLSKLDGFVNNPNQAYVQKSSHSPPLTSSIPTSRNMSFTTTTRSARQHHHHRSSSAAALSINNNSSTTPSPPPPQQQRLSISSSPCEYFFIRGQCKYGRSCRFSHVLNDSNINKLNDKLLNNHHANLLSLQQSTSSSINNNNNNSSSSTLPHHHQNHNSKSNRICGFFHKGRCKFGQACRFRHL